MGATGIDFVDIVHVKVGVIAHQKIYLGVPYGGKFLSETLGSSSVIEEHNF